MEDLPAQGMGERMTFWLIRADYRPLTEKTPKRAYVSDSGRTERYVKHEFLIRFPALRNIEVKQVTEEEMERLSVRKWIMWI